MQSGGKCEKEFPLDLIYRKLHNKHFLSSSGTQMHIYIYITVSSARGTVADCIYVQTDLWHCTYKTEGKHCNCLLPSLAEENDAILKVQVGFASNICTKKQQQQHRTSHKVKSVLDNRNTPTKRPCHSSYTWP